MKIFEFQKINTENFEFRQEKDVWILLMENKEKQELYNNLYIQILQDANKRDLKNNHHIFTENEISFIKKYLILNNYTPKYRDTELENKLKKVLEIFIQKNDISPDEIIENMTYHDQTILANELNRKLKDLEIAKKF